VCVCVREEREKKKKKKKKRGERGGERIGVGRPSVECYKSRIYHSLHYH